MSGLASNGYANRHAPLRDAYAINVSTNEEKKTLEETLSKLRAEHYGLNERKRSMEAAYIFCGLPINVGTALGITAYLYGNPTMSSVFDGLMTLVLAYMGTLGFSDKIATYFENRLVNKRNAIMEKYSLIIVRVKQEYKPESLQLISTGVGYHNVG